jgi:hypothetical protein
MDKLIKRKRKEDKIDSQHVDDLMARLRCGESSCPNENAWCYVVDGIHLKIIGAQMKTWSMMINDDDGVDLETCPTVLAKTLMPSRKSGKNPLREQASKAPSISNSSSSATPAPGQLPPPLPPHLPPHPYYYGDPYHPPTHHHYRQRSPYTPTPFRSDVVASSPIAFEIDDNGDKLTNYFDWLTGVYPAMEKQLQECLLTLKTNGVVYGTLLDVPATLWKEYSILPGLVIMIQGHTKKWNREQAKGRA